MIDHKSDVEYLGPVDMTIRPAAHSEQLEHDKSATFAVDLAAKELNRAIEVCSKRGMTVDITTIVLNDMRRGRIVTVSATVSKS